MHATKPIRDMSRVTSEDLKPLHILFEKGLAEQTMNIAESLFVQLLESEGKCNLARKEDLAKLALEQTERLALDLGGGSFYMRKGLSQKLGQRNQKIIAEFNGKNYSDLARKYGVSDVRIRQILGKKKPPH